MREPKFEKEQKQQPSKSTGRLNTKSNATGAPGVSRVPNARSIVAGRGRPALHWLVPNEGKLRRSDSRDVLLGEAGDAFERSLQLPVKSEEHTSELQSLRH